ncbi:hypothetical protein [Halomonas sp. WWR20]
MSETPVSPENAALEHSRHWKHVLGKVNQRIDALPPYQSHGRITRATGMVLEAVGLRLPLGSACQIELFAHDKAAGEPGRAKAQRYAEAEVVGFAGEKLFLMPLGEISGLLPGARVFALGTSRLDGASARRFPIGATLLGRVVDGNGTQGGGSITAFYTVLTEGDDQQDPIADSARAILDGHIVLSRQLAESGHYPAIDIEASISRAMTAIVDTTHQMRAQRFKQMISRYQRNRDLISVGAYAPGHDPQLDRAVALYPRLEGFLQQRIDERADVAATQSALGTLLPEVKT